MKYHFYSKEIESVLNSDVKARVKYFKHKVADWETIWLLEDNNRFIINKTSNDEILILWPFKEFAEKTLKNHPSFDKGHLVGINIYEFLEDYLDATNENNVKLFVFPGRAMDGALFSPYDFRNMMEEELARYGDYD